MLKLHVSGHSSPEDSEQIQNELMRRAKRNERITFLLPFAGVLALIVLFTTLTGGQFLSVDNLKLLLNQCFSMEIVVIGGAFLYAIGGLDMAIGSVMALSAMVITLLFNAGLSLALSILAGIAVSVGSMCITAFVRNYLKVSPFIASMCVMNICQGLVLTIVAKLGVITFAYSRAAWIDSTLTKILTLVIMALLGYVIFNYTRFGKSLRAIGGNERAARISGIKIEKCVFGAYSIMGLALAIASLFSVIRGGTADTSIGNGMNLNVMTAIVLGGFPLSGGANAKFHAPMIGALMVTILTNGLGLLGYANSMGYAIKGLLFVTVVALTYEKSKGKLIS